MWFKKQNIASDEELKSAATDMKEGSVQAFRVLYNAYGQKVYRYCLRLLGDVELANDAFQETFLKVYENRDYFKGDNFAAWLFTIARNTCISQIRTRKDFEQIAEGQLSSESIVTEDFGLKNEIKNAINKLPLLLKEAIVLREYQDCTYQEIAEILQIDVSLAKVRVYRARIILKKLLKPIVRELNES